jgi:hypothetical protein
MRLRVSNFYGIYRIDHDSSRTHSWLVTLQRRGHIYHRQFSDRFHGGKRQALRVAKAYRVRLASELLPLTRQELCAIKKKNNRSGISGVSRIDVWEKNRARIYRRIYLDAQWPTDHGKARHKKFSVKRYGERGAFLRALKTRRQALEGLIIQDHARNQSINFIRPLSPRGIHPSRCPLFSTLI